MTFIEYEIGAILDDSVEIFDYAEGGLGRVYFGYCRNRQIRIAVKTLLRSIWEENRLAKCWPQIKNELISGNLPSRCIDVGEYLFFSFFREARLVCRSRNHPNVLQGTRLWWSDDGQPFYECEFVENSNNLNTVLRNIKKNNENQRFAVLQALHIAVSFCNGMIYVSHEMISQYNKTHARNPAVMFIHRDIKPENILLDDRNSVKIIDMGIAKFLLSKNISSFVSFPLVGGASRYMAPEQAISFESVLPSSDIFSFAMTMLELLGENLGNISSFAENNEIYRLPGIPDELCRILSKCLRLNMADRYQNFKELRADLVSFICQVKNGHIALGENQRCSGCGYISPERRQITKGKNNKPRPGINGHQFVRIAAGSFFKGCTKEQARAISSKFGLGETFSKEIYQEIFLDDFEIDRCPVTNVQYYTFLQETGHPHPKHWLKQRGPNTDRPFSTAEGKLPVVNVSYQDASAYCRWAGLRLPNGDEWEKAARGDKGQLYPWGDKYNAEYCNSAETGKNGPTNVDDYPRGMSPYGCLQMTGNIFEWVAEFHPQNKDYKYLRGGSWAVSCELLGLPFLHYLVAPEHLTNANGQKDIFGFRCARDIDINSDKLRITDHNHKDICPLCGGEMIEFDLTEIKIPEKNIYSWVGYFDIEQR